ncbi:MAG: pyrroloquinoline quinone-dependent dehydrogenase [Candidatus Hydrogenedentes bacterium]|nr:pyrroloquinoline quinone-dependent dehydrogenase [Candidatus Hydrogenedentota bacterium]
MATQRKAKRSAWRILLRLLVFVAVAYLAWYFWPVHVRIAMDGPTATWPDYGNDKGGSRYSPLTQITPANVKYLQKAWEYHTGDVSDGKGAIKATSAFEATPILNDGRLYFPSPFNKIIALDPETGKEIWKYDPKIDLSVRYSNQLTSRGVTYWEDASGVDPHPKRIFAATCDGRLIALDAVDGTPCKDFGSHGAVDLKRGVGEERWIGEYQMTSPPAVAGDHVILGSAVSDNQRVDAPSGVVRAYNARTGALAWTWDLAPPPDKYTGPAQPKTEEGYTLGTPNVWAQFSVDEERDLVFMPTGNPAPDFYGGERYGSDYYGSSVVAVRASTGEVVWHFQTVHHDLWDYDVPCQPTLATIMRDGREVPVVIQATKMGLIFVLNRETGEPVFPVEERPVPQSNVSGEQTSPTQPFPVKPAPLIPHTLSPDEGWGLTSSGKKESHDRIAALHYEGIYTPPRVNEPILMFPGNAGGTNWGGVAVDPVRQTLVVNASVLGFIVTLIPRAEFDEIKKNNPDAEIQRQDGTPYGMRRDYLLGSSGLPCNPPPWGTLAAIDLNTGDIAWQVPFGTVRDIAPVPIPINYGVPNLGGPLVTASGLIFIGAAMDDYIRAYDIETGKELWKGRLPAGGQATPMTYRLRKDSKQYVVIAAGGHGRAGTKLGDSVIAYALP